MCCEATYIFAEGSRASRMLALFTFVVALNVAGAQAALVFSALKEGRWSVYWQEDIGKPPIALSRDSQFDQTSPAFGGDIHTVALEGSRSEVLIFERARVAESDWALDQTITNAVRPTWHAGIRGWMFARFTVTKEGEDSDLFTVLPKGSPELLVKHTGNQDYPSVSSDGSKLIYTSTQIVSVRGGAIDAYQQLWLVDFQRNRTSLVFSKGRENIDCAWSQKGDRVAFAASHGEGFEILALEPSSARAQQITRGPGIKTHPAWSPDGKRIMFTKFHGGKYSLATVAEDGSDIQPYEPLGPDVQCRDADWR